MQKVITYQQRTFEMDSLIDAPGVRGYTDGEQWNGFACPRFERSEADQIVTAMERQRSGSARYEAETDTFIIGDTGDADADEYAAVGELVETVDGPKTLYPIGTWIWTWQEVID